jgi:hypothetical protein
MPFVLPNPVIDYGLYYRGYLPFTPLSYPAVLGSENKTTTQYRIELQNMYDHGVRYPTLTQGSTAYESGRLEDIIKMRKSIGFPMDNLYVMNTPIDLFRTGSTADKLTTFSLDLARWKTIATNNGYSQVYIYGIDEPDIQLFLNEQDAWKLVHDNGMKIFSSIDSIKLSGEILIGKYILPDLAILVGSFNRSVVDGWHSQDKKIFSYGNPQVGIEDPALYRKNYGFELWNAGYDGEMNYAYQHGFGSSIWNDFDHSRYRDHVFAYPTTDGVIDTVQWEGFREAIDERPVEHDLSRHRADLFGGRSISPLGAHRCGMGSACRTQLRSSCVGSRGTVARDRHFWSQNFFSILG